MISQPKINSTSVRQLLKAWEYPAKLGKHPLAQLACVEHYLNKLGRSESDIKRGLAVKEILNDGIQTLRPPSGDPDPYAKEWRTYLILTERYCFGRLPEWIIVNLSISSRSFYRELKDGVDQLVIFLNHLEEESQNNLEEIILEDSTKLPVGKLQPPALPDQAIIGRSSLTKTISELVIKQKIKKIALFGLPGVGKTTATLEILEDQEIIDYFVDGFVWIGLGPNVSLEQELYRLASFAGINDSQIGQLSTDELRVQIRHSLSSKKILFVFDDAWDAGDLHYLCLQSKDSAVLCTTRQPSLAIDFAQPVGALSVSELDLNQSKHLLNEIAADLFDGQDEKIETLYQLAGGLPLALTIFGRYLRRQGYQGQKNRLQVAFENLKERSSRQSLSINLEQHDLSGSREKSLGDVIGLSCDTLTPTARQLFHSLSIIPPKPNSFDFDTALNLADHSAQPLYELIDSGLVESVGEDRYTLHQAIFDVAGSIDPPKTATSRFVESMQKVVEQGESNYKLLEPNRTNIDAALALCFEGGLIHEASQILVLFGPFLLDRGQIKFAEEYLALLGQHFEAASYPPDIVNEIYANIEFLHGAVANQLGKYDDALNHLNEVVEAAETAPLRDTRLKSLAILLDIYGKRSDQKRVQELVEQIKHQTSQSTNAYLVGEVYSDLSYAYYTLNEMELAHEYILKAKSVYEKNGFNMGMIWLTYGLILFDSDLSSTIMYYEKALTAFQENGMEGDRINVLNNIAVVYMLKAQWTKALELSKEVYQFRQELGDPDGCAISLVNLSYVTLALRDAESASEYIEAGLVLARETKVQYREASLLINKSALGELRGDFELAIESGKEAFEIATKANLSMSQGLAAAKMAIAYLAQDLLSEAEYWVTISYDTFKGLDLPHMLAHSNKLMAELYFRKDELAKAHAHLEEALPYFDKTIEGVTDPIEVLQTSAQILRQVGDDKRAEEYLHKARILIKQQSGQIKDPTLKKAFLDHYNSNF